MAKQSLLVADADPRSLRILDVALRKAGFQVGTASDGAEAQRRVQRSPPDLVLADLGLPGFDGISLCKAIRADPKLTGIPVILISADKDPRVRSQAIEAGADDFLGKPLLIKELTQRVRMLLVRREQQRMSLRGTPAALTGAIVDLGLIDVFQSLDGWKRSAVVGCEWGDKLAQVWVRDGQVVDCETGQLVGEAAFYRLLHWEGGNFRVEFGPVDREPRIEVSTQGLVLEAMRRVDEMGRLAESVPLSSKLSVDFSALAKRLADLPDEVNGVLRLLDGQRPLSEVIDRSPIDDLATLVVVQRLLNEKVLQHSAGETVKMKVKPTLDQWLGPDSPVQPQYTAPDAPTPALGYQLPQTDPLAQEAAEQEAAPVSQPPPAPEPVAPQAAISAPPLPPALPSSPSLAALPSAQASLPLPPAPAVGALARPSEDSPQASFDLPAELVRALTPPGVAPVEPREAPPAVEVERASLQVAAAFAHADAQAALAAAPAAPVKTETFKLPAEPKKPVALVRFPPLRGVRRERLRREADEARLQLTSGRPVRLTHLVELPAWPVAAGEAVRSISPAVSDAAKRFAPDVPVAAVAGLPGARASANGARAPSTAAEGLAGTAALLGELPVPSPRIPDTEPAPPPAFTPVPSAPPAVVTPAPAPSAASPTPAPAGGAEHSFEAKPLSAADLARTDALAPASSAIGTRPDGSPWDDNTEPGAATPEAPTSPGHKIEVPGDPASPDAPTSPGHRVEVPDELRSEGDAHQQSLALLSDLIGPSAAAIPAGPVLPAASGEGTPIPAVAQPIAEVAAKPAPAPAVEAKPATEHRQEHEQEQGHAHEPEIAPPLRPVSAKQARVVSPRAQPPAKSADDEFDAEIRAALGKGKKRPWALYAAAAVGVLALAWFFRPQPETVNKELLGNIVADRGADKPAPAAPKPEVAAAPAPAPQPAVADAGVAAVPPDAGALAPAPVKPDEPKPDAPKADAPAPLDDYAKALAEGEGLLKRGKYKAAVTSLKKAVSLNPESVPALLELGDAFLEADQPKNAIRPLEKAARLDPKNGRSQLLLGTAFQSLGKNPDATKAYKRYLELDPSGEYARDVRSILANLQH